MRFSLRASLMSHGIGALFALVLLRKARRRCCASELSTLPRLKGFVGSRTTVLLAPRKKTLRAALGSSPSMAFILSMTSIGAPTSLLTIFVLTPVFHRKTQSMTDGKAQPSNSPRTRPLYSASSDSMARLPLKPWTAILCYGAAPLPRRRRGVPISRRRAVDVQPARRWKFWSLLLSLTPSMRRSRGGVSGTLVAKIV